ncbi:NAD(P)H-hydrate dehydratase [uncultured Eubacterium sp.]|uniref:NAD(P)H-hydrate dehydratase n=1 Tax=uncultured Eubacterium sp. TaxID=165185 RepID=UPI0026726832|nr:NAD(P)H-hydrate dehydratase [uncultured Eubacterium sp.]
MKNIVTGTDMKKVDSYTINEIGIPSVVLMERAALSVANLIEKNEYKYKKVKTIQVIAGIGNNGADGLAIGRMLYLLGHSICIFVLGDIEKATDEFKLQMDIVKNLGIEVTDSLIDADIVVDAIFGVGLSREVSGKFAELIDEVNKMKNIIYAVDIPSGINADTAEVMGKAVKANYTVTFGSHKVGTVLYPGAEYCGEVTVSDIGFPERAYDLQINRVKYATGEDLSWIPKRANYSNKGTYGKILIIAGSKDISGAAVLCAKAAFRAGAGLVRVFTHENNREIIGRLLPEAMINTYNTEKFDFKILESCLKWCDVVAVGPGLGIGTVQKMIVEKVIESGIQAVIDADGINNVADDERIKKKLHKKLILTPHLGEMGRFIHKPVKDIAKHLIQYAKDANYKYGVNIILKDARTVIATEGQVYINLTGNSGMATAGSGDVLTGMIAGLIGVGTDFNKVSFIAPYVHGLAGDRAAEKVSKSGLMASDIIEELKNIIID